MKHPINPQAMPGSLKGVRAGDTPMKIELRLNGVPRSGYCEPRELLSDFIRHGLGATGTHVGCEHGVCGACTVQVDGIAMRSCLMLAPQAEGREITTVEGLAPDQTLGELQESFRAHHALQCGFCTAGILMSVSAYLLRNPDPSEAELREMLSGHLCRCTGYTPIVAAVLAVTARRAGRSPDESHQAPSSSRLSVPNA
jgi:2-furoyl-CoA dehydrogenase 2Fe-2S iron sulfur subunit